MDDMMRSPDTDDVANLFVEEGWDKWTQISKKHCTNKLGGTTIKTGRWEMEPSPMMTTSIAVENLEHPWNIRW
jgi:hypothetical protein